MDSPEKAASASKPPALPVEARARRTCFVISPIGPPDSETRKKADQALKHLIKQALEPDYEVKRADDEDRPGLITVQILQRIFDADLVIADLTDRNPNVFYELAIRHAYRKPAIHIITKGDDIPFDVQEMRVVPYDLTNPDSLEEARNKIREHARAIDNKEPVITPVQIAEILQPLKEGENEQIRALFASLSAGISNLQEGVAFLVQEQRKSNQRDFLETFGGPGNLLWTQSPSGFNFATGQPSIYQPSVYKASDSETQRRAAKANAIAGAKKSKADDDK